MLTSTALRETRFHVTRFREGYDISEVDDLLERLATTLEALELGRSEHEPVTVDELLDARFETTRLGAGYDVVEVDDLLDMGIEALRQHADAASAAASVEAAAWAAATAAASAEARAHAPASDDVVPAYAGHETAPLASVAAPVVSMAPSSPAMTCSAVARELSLAQATSYGDNRDVLVVVGPDGSRWAATSVTRTDTGVVLTVS